MHDYLWLWSTGLVKVAGGWTEIQRYAALGLVTPDFVLVMGASYAVSDGTVRSLCGVPRHRYPQRSARLLNQCALLRCVGSPVDVNTAADLLLLPGALVIPR